ncbi:hypothetical protein J0H58_30880 [bacterium]|nr:hypothetical protein [bacterium]
MIRTLTVVVLVVGATFAGGPTAPADDPPKLDSVARLRVLGRPTIGPAAALIHAYGTVAAVDDRSITIRSQFGDGGMNAKEEDDSGTGRYGRWVREDPTKPIVLLYPGWVVDCLAYRHTPEGMVVTVVTGQEVLVKNADLPTRRFPATPELRNGAPHSAIPTAGHRHCHLLADVRVGDEVTLYLTGPSGKEECVWVGIRRRPGGRVPPSQHQNVFGETIERCNAYQDHEENGTPIPDRFRRDLQRLRPRRFPRDEAPAPPPPKRP